jgi:uncharacterized protein YoxC
MTVALVIFALAVFVLLVWVINKMVEIDDIKEELDKYSVYLDERANKLAMWEQELNQYDLKK